MSASIHRTPAGREAILAAYARRLDALALPVVSRTVPTRHGATHLLLAGPEDAPPLVGVPGTGGSALDLAEAWPFFAERNRCVFVDVPGQPNRSEEIRPDKAGADYARWMEDVLDALGLARPAFVGMSMGAYVLLRCAAWIPERMARMALVVPEGLVRARLPALLRDVTWPLLRHRLAPTEANLRRLLAALSTPGAPVPDAALDWMRLVTRHAGLGTDLGPLFRKGELARLEAPVLVVAGGRDPLFPGARLIRRARRVIPTLRDAILVPEAGHLDPAFAAGPVMERVRAFLEGADEPTPRGAG
ncbi:MAG: alpha/beta hydrolase [Myxococcota bacterium]|nr:alpha/beta hydrolase [Myxococcota bacterium]